MLGCAHTHQLGERLQRTGSGSRARRRWPCPAVFFLLHSRRRWPHAAAAPRASAAMADRQAVQEALQAAISRGAPLFNAGRPRDCFLLYANTATQLMAAQLASPAEAAALRAAVAAGMADGDDSAAAWTMRCAVDAILGATPAPAAARRHPPPACTTTAAAARRLRPARALPPLPTRCICAPRPLPPTSPPQTARWRRRRTRRRWTSPPARPTSHCWTSHPACRPRRAGGP